MQEALNTDFATPDDVRFAIENLSSEDFYKIHQAAKISCIGTGYHSPEEIINEAIVRAMNPTDKKGLLFRRWNKNVPFVAFMIKTIGGLVDDSRNTLSQKNTQHYEELKHETETDEDILGRLGNSQNDVVDQVINLEDIHERQRQAKKASEKIQNHFQDDEEVSWIILGLSEGQKPSQICELAGVSQTQYNTARRRLRRGINKLFPGRSIK